MAAVESATTPALTTVEINECMFCTHLKEVCTECDYDGREENDGYFGVSPPVCYRWISRLIGLLAV